MDGCGVMVEEEQVRVRLDWGAPHLYCVSSSVPAELPVDLVVSFVGDEVDWWRAVGPPTAFDGGGAHTAVVSCV